MGEQFNSSSITMQAFFFLLLAAVAFAEPEAKPEAEADPALLYSSYYGFPLRLIRLRILRLSLRLQQLLRIRLSLQLRIPLSLEEGCRGRSYARGRGRPRCP